MAACQRHISACWLILRTAAHEKQMKSIPTAQPAAGVCLSHQERHRQDSELLRRVCPDHVLATCPSADSGVWCSAASSATSPEGCVLASWAVCWLLLSPGSFLWSLSDPLPLQPLLFLSVFRCCGSGRRWKAWERGDALDNSQNLLPVQGSPEDQAEGPGCLLDGMDGLPWRQRAERRTCVCW